MNIEILHKIEDIKVLVFGDYMVDKYIIGNVNRISPEAPVPVIEVKNQSQKLGGAGNVINNIISLGANVKVLGCVGNDDAGNFITNYFNNDKTNISYLKKYNQLSTIIKTRIVSKNQQFLRIDEEKKEPLLQEYYDYAKDNLDEIFCDIDVVIISDYAKGAVTKEIAQLLIKQANKKNIPIIVDPKGNDYSKYVGATVCTPNVKELCDVFDICVSQNKPCVILAQTIKGKGVSFMEGDKNWHHGVLSNEQYEQALAEVNK